MKHQILFLTLTIILLSACQPLITNPEPKEPIEISVQEVKEQPQEEPFETPQVKPRDVGRLYDTYEDVPEICREACEGYKEWEFQDDCHQAC